MATEDASLRQDLIENAVQHEVVPIQETVPTEQSLDPSFAAELEHDLTIWPREYLETYLDSDDQGRIPLNEATLQDLLESAFDRNEQLIHSSRHGLISKTAASFEKQDYSGEQFPRPGKPPERSELFQAAQAQAHSLLGPSAETRYPLIENSVYVGNIISETAEYLVQGFPVLPRFSIQNPCSAIFRRSVTSCGSRTTTRTSPSEKWRRGRSRRS